MSDIIENRLAKARLGRERSSAMMPLERTMRCPSKMNRCRSYEISTTLL